MLQTRHLNRSSVRLSVRHWLLSAAGQSSKASWRFFLKTDVLRRADNNSRHRCGICDHHTADPSVRTSVIRRSGSQQRLAGQFCAIPATEQRQLQRAEKLSTLSTWHPRSSDCSSVRPSARPSASQHRRTSLYVVNTSSQYRAFRTSKLAAASLSTSSTRSTDPVRHQRRRSTTSKNLVVSTCRYR